MRLILLIILSLQIFLAGWLRAWSADPDFNLDRNVGLSTEIVIGKLLPDGRLKEIRPIFGYPPGHVSYGISDGANYFKTVEGIVGDSPFLEVVAFLDTISDPDSCRTVDLITFTQAGGVCGRFHDRTPSGMLRIGLHQLWKRADFLAELEHSLARRKELDGILGLPKSRERMEKLFTFMRAHVDWPKFSDEHPYEWPWSEGHFFWKCVRKSIRPSTGEENVIRDELKRATSDNHIAMTLAFIGCSGCSKSFLEDVARYRHRSRSPTIRQQAFRALMEIDNYSGSALLAEFLNTEDPELRTIKLNLQERGMFKGLPREETQTLNADVPGALQRFSDQVLQSRQAGNQNDGYSVISLLHCYHHPLVISSMFCWTRQGDSQERDKATELLRKVLLEDPTTPFSTEQLEQWWNQSAATFSRSYLLQSAEGCERWLQAWKKARNPVEKRLLMRLWDFEPSVPEKVLLDACEGKNGPRAKLLLSKLWKKGRLSTGARKVLITRYLEMSLVETPLSGFPDGYRSVDVLLRRRFPFPEQENLYLTGDVGVGRDPVLPPNMPVHSLWISDVRQNRLHGLDASGYGLAKAVVEVFEQDPRATPPSDVWRMRWELDESSSRSGTSVEIPVR